MIGLIQKLYEQDRIMTWGGKGTMWWRRKEEGDERSQNHAVIRDGSNQCLQLLI